MRRRAAPLRFVEGSIMLNGVTTLSTVRKSAIRHTISRWCKAEAASVVIRAVPLENRRLRVDYKARLTVEGCQQSHVPRLSPPLPLTPCRSAGRYRARMRPIRSGWWRY